MGERTRELLKEISRSPGLLSENASLRKRCWGQHSWGRGYRVASSGNATDEVWKKYSEDQKPEVPDDNFKIVQGSRPQRRPSPTCAVTGCPRLLASVVHLPPERPDINQPPASRAASIAHAPRGRFQPDTRAIPIPAPRPHSADCHRRTRLPVRRYPFAR